MVKMMYKMQKAILSRSSYDDYLFSQRYCLAYLISTASATGVQPDVVEECEWNRIHTRLLTQSSHRLEVSQYAEDSYTDWTYLEVTLWYTLYSMAVVAMVIVQDMIQLSQRDDYDDDDHNHH